METALLIGIALIALGMLLFVLEAFVPFEQIPAS